MAKKVARDIMTTDVLTVRDDWSLTTVADFFIENGISGAPVVSEDDELVGVISMSDLAAHAADSTQKGGRKTDEPIYYRERLDARLSNEDMHQLRIKESENATARDVMTAAVFSVEESASISDVAGTMVQGRIHRVIVADGLKVVGIVTSLDLMKLLVDD